MKQEFSHTLGLDKLKDAVNLAFASYSQRLSRYDPELEWTGEFEARVRFQVSGLTIRCDLFLFPETIEVHAEVPVAFRLFKKRARIIVARELDRWCRVVQSEE